MNERCIEYKVVSVGTPDSPKKVSFNRSVEVVLIPCLSEYREAEVCGNLWWTVTDMRIFQAETIRSIRKYMQVMEVSDRRIALKLLMQDESFDMEKASQLV